MAPVNCSSNISQCCAGNLSKSYPCTAITRIHRQGLTVPKGRSASAPPAMAMAMAMAMATVHSPDRARRIASPVATADDAWATE